MEYQDRIICFLDILGFREHISQSLRPDGNDSTEKINQLADSLNGVREIFDVDHPEMRPQTEITQFSDSIALSFASNAESGVFDALLSILWVQIGLARRGILCRGSVARGKLLHTPTLLFGPAMVDAYLLESQAALYPRVILDETIIEAGILAHARQHGPEYEEQSIMSLLSRDADGMYYIDYITKAQSELDDPEYDYPEYLSQLRQIISAGLELRSPSVTIKYRWLKEKFSRHLTQVKQNVTRNARTSSAVDAELCEAYHSIPDFEVGRPRALRREREHRPRRTRVERP